jgi:aspartate/methionine/tyrosine aminotransferase
VEGHFEGSRLIGRSHGRPSDRHQCRISGRVPDDFEPNPLSRLLAAKRSGGRQILDLTVTNPTKVGLAVAPARLGDRPIGAYEPDSRGSRVARGAVAAYLAERESRDVLSPDRLVLTASTSESYAHLFRLLCDPGDDVLVPTPSYPLFEPLARIEGVEVREYELRLEEPMRDEATPSDAASPVGAPGPIPARWRVDADELDALAGPRTRAVLLVQPNNPTGSCVTAEDLAAIEEVAERRGLAMISDEVFGDFPWPPRSSLLPSLLSASRQVPTFVLGGISKLCGLPQLKLGWIAVTGPDRETERMLEGLEWIADLFLSTSAPVEAALPELLAGRHAFQAVLRERLESNLELLRGSAGPWRLIEARGGWSAVLGLEESRGDLSDTAERILERQDVLLHPGHFYGLSDRSVVLSLIVESWVMKEALQRLERG